MTHNLLTEPTFLTDTSKGVSELTLPGLMAGLSNGEVRGLKRVQAHQLQSTYCFLVQLGALMGHGPGGAEEDVWHERLLALTDGAHEPWCLFDVDPEMPGFLQVPMGGEVYVPWTRTPDELDVLVMSKSHDVKTGRIREPLPEHWVHSLLNLQTVEGQMGRGNYGIARMNSGYGTRPFLHVTSALELHERWRRDLVRLAVDNTHRGHKLLWLVPWNGVETLTAQEVDPLCVEICRRVRLNTSSDGVILCEKAGTKAPRMEKGAVLDDPWAPRDASKGVTLTPTARSFGRRHLVSMLLEQGVELPELGRVRGPQDRIVWWEALIRGQGKTDGHHLRVLVLPEQLCQALGHPESSSYEALKARYLGMEERVSTMQNQVLYPALMALVKRTEWVSTWTERFEHKVDALYFEHLSSEVEGLNMWEQVLAQLSHQVLEEAIREASTARGTSYKSIVRAEGLFHGLCSKHCREDLHQAP